MKFRKFIGRGSQKMSNNEGCIAAQPANTPMVEQARILKGALGF